MSLPWISPHRWAKPPSSSQHDWIGFRFTSMTSPFFQDTPLGTPFGRRNVVTTKFDLIKLMKPQ